MEIFMSYSVSRIFISPQVCELDIIFNFEKAYFILDELLLGGEIQETSKKNVLKAIAAQDLLQEVSYGDTSIEL
jgi:AP-1 complex subunit sigma 1/2